MTAARISWIAIGLFVGLQFVPYARDHASPPKRVEPNWDSPETRETFFRVCRDCHSNETSWPWYAYVAPVSWLVRYDVDEGRSHFNVSDWGRDPQHGDEAAKMVREGKMPLWFYLPLHPEARLSPEERSRFIRGLERTFGEPSGAHSHPEEHGGHEH